MYGEYLYYIIIDNGISQQAQLYFSRQEVGASFIDLWRSLIIEEFDVELIMFEPEKGNTVDRPKLEMHWQYSEGHSTFNYTAKVEVVKGKQIC